MRLKIIIFFLAFLASGLGFAVASEVSDLCSRESWKYDTSKSPKKDETIGFYTNISASKTDVDHIVSLHDACQSGGKHWSPEQKKQFANDAENHVAALERVNRGIKNKYTPKDFIERMNDNADYRFYGGRVCQYITRYISIKLKYGLSFDNNDKAYISGILNSCYAA